MDSVIPSPDVRSIYEIPIDLEEQGFLRILEEKFSFSSKKKLENWKKIVYGMRVQNKSVKIAICGKYTGISDSYASLVEALKHAGAKLGTRVEIKFVETTNLERAKMLQSLEKSDGIIVPIGFGKRGSEGKIECAKYAREKDVPYLGLCYGLQIAVIEFARNVCGLKKANSTEINPRTKHPLVMILPEQKDIKEKGASMRLGSVKSQLKKGSQVSKLYGKTSVSERHRHRYEVNPEYHQTLKKNGMVISGTSRNGSLVEFIEIPELKYFVATQAHPEYKSRVEKTISSLLWFSKSSFREEIWQFSISKTMILQN